MSKLITFAVPCYNSAAYMDHCVRTLLTGGDDIEIILVDDGSPRMTPPPSATAIRQSIQTSCGPSTRRTAATVRGSTRASATKKRLPYSVGTRTTGWTRRP